MYAMKEQGFIAGMGGLKTIYSTVLAFNPLGKFAYESFGPSPNLVWVNAVKDCLA